MYSPPDFSSNPLGYPYFKSGYHSLKPTYSSRLYVYLSLAVNFMTMFAYSLTSCTGPKRVHCDLYGSIHTPPVLSQEE